MICEQCKKSMSRQDTFGLIVRQKKMLTLCPTCYRDIHDKEVKEMEISKEALARSGLLQQGFNSSDLKQLLRLWTKRQ